MRNGLPPDSFSRAPDAEGLGHPNKQAARVSTLATAKSGGDARELSSTGQRYKAHALRNRLSL